LSAQVSGILENPTFLGWFFLDRLGILRCMPKRSSKKRLPDPNELAFTLARQFTGESSSEGTVPRMGATVTAVKNPAAVTLGRLGGLKGGLARAKKLSKKARVRIARKAALARWGSKHGKRKGQETTKAETAASL
jgi:hypothetical protein